jgi:hypothetical protein
MRLGDLNAGVPAATAPSEWTPDRRFLQYPYAPPTTPMAPKGQAVSSEPPMNRGEIRAGLVELGRRMEAVTHRRTDVR